MWRSHPAERPQLRGWDCQKVAQLAHHECHLQLLLVENHGLTVEVPSWLALVGPEKMPLLLLMPSVRQTVNPGWWEYHGVVMGKPVTRPMSRALR